MDLVLGDSQEGKSVLSRSQALGGQSTKTDQDHGQIGQELHEPPPPLACLKMDLQSLPLLH
jgi:hypothetical protein